MRKNLLFIFALLLTAVTGAWADDSGSCGAVSYSYVESTHTLTISGTGAMADYYGDFLQPWYDYQEEITTVVIEDGVTSIGDYAFAECSGLTSITIPASVTSIGDYAFAECSGLTSVEIPNSVTNIGDYAFYYCSGLTSIEIPNSVTSIGDWAFEGCSGLTSVTIPNSVTSIGIYAFYDCSGLTSIEIPNSVTSIGGYAFQYCSGLTSLTIPNSVTSIGYGAFSYCSGLTSVSVEKGNSMYDSRNNCNAIIETSTNTLIAGCMNSIIPNSVTNIGERAFLGCTGLTSIEIPNSVTSIGNEAFYNCSGLTSVTIGNSVTSIGDYAFDECYSLTSIEIPNSVTSIGGSAFYGTPWYNNQPDGLVYAGKVAYEYKGTMPANTSITIKEGTLGIGDYAFYYCNGLTSITIPASVTSIGDYAFTDCSNLVTVTLNSYPFIGSGAFYGIADGATVTMNLTGHEGETGEYWMTFYNDSYNFQADANTQVFKAALDEKSLTLTELAEDKIVQWDNAVILKSTSSSMVMTLTTTDSSNDFSNNWLCGVDDPAGLVGDGTIYVLGKGSGGVGFYKLETGSTLGYGKAYLEYDGGSESNFFGFEDGETTRVIQIENGKLKVENLNSGWYTLGGLKLQGEPTEKGVYIYNGKKVVK